MDQNWEADEPTPAFELMLEGDTQVQPEIFYIAVKLALARLEQYSATTTG